MKEKPIFYQLFEHESSTYTYLLADTQTKEAILIDPVFEMVDRDVKLITELDLKLKYVLDTHIHADHVTAAGMLREKTGAKTCVSQHSGSPCADILLFEGDELRFGEHTLKVLETPGHTNGCLTYLVDDMLFTGDALLIRGNGRTDFQQGSSEKLYNSLQKIFNLGKDFTVYPAHDYRGQTKTTVELEKKFNPRIGGGKSKEEFIKIMGELNLANPKKIMEAVPANMACGYIKNVLPVNTFEKNGILETTAEELFRAVDKKELLLIDVREASEFTGDLGHIKNSKLVTLGNDLKNFLEGLDRSEEIIFICRSGNRSAQAAHLSQEMGFKFAINLSGGLLHWNELNYPVER